MDPGSGPARQMIVSGTSATRSTRPCPGRSRMSRASTARRCSPGQAMSIRRGSASWPRPSARRVDGLIIVPASEDHTYLLPETVGPAPVTALFCGNNRVTVLALRELAAIGRRVAVVGFDDLELAGLLTPGISVVAQNPGGDGPDRGRAAVPAAGLRRRPGGAGW